MSERKRRRAMGLFGAGLALVLLGQAYFIWLPRYVWDGVIFCVLGALLWMVALRYTEPSAPTSSQERRFAFVTADPLRTALLAVGTLLVLAAGVGARRASPEADFTPYFSAWVLGLLLFMLALAPRWTFSPRVVWSAIARNRREILPLVALLLAAFLARAVALDDAPANFGGDEGTQALEAVRLLGPPLGNPFATGWYSVPTMSFLVAGLGMRLFGFTVTGVRMLSALAGTAAVLATCLLARELAGRWVGWGAAVLVAFGHYAVHFSRLASNQIADALFGPLILYLLLRVLRSEEGGGCRLPFLSALAGIALGLSWYAYFGARLFTVVVALYLLGRSLAEPGFLSRHRSHLAWMALGAALAVWPLALHYLAHPEDFLARYNQVSIFASGWLRNEMALTGRSALSLLLQQFWKSVSAFNVTTDPTFWYRPGIPYLDPVSGVFFILGLTVAFRRARQPGGGLLLLWFWSFILLGWTLTENPPSSQRGVGSIPVVAILVALGLTETLQGLSCLVGDGRGILYRALFGLLLVAITLFNLAFYFWDYTPRRVYGNPTAEVADVLCDELERRTEVPLVYFDGPPFMYWDFGGIAFRLRGVAGRDFVPQEEEPPDCSRGALFVILGEKASDLDVVRALCPGGVVTPFYSSADHRLLFMLYEVHSTPMRKSVPSNVFVIPRPKAEESRS